MNTLLNLLKNLWHALGCVGELLGYGPVRTVVWEEESNPLFLPDLRRAITQS